ncbi:MAG: GH3 auxin-responsive promoter family protein [Saprospiraceae bacterium]|nr:GH3 auxin-responsive promoter family protein [Saprospiraceae bacterium]
MKTKWWNDLWLWSNRRHHQEFVEQILYTEKIQKQILSQYIQKNKNTLFGIDFNFSKIKTYEDYKNFVPLIDDYEDIRPYIQKIAHGENNILTTEPTLFFERTSGSTGKAKLIPYTPSLKIEFQKGIAVWMHELRKEYPKALMGKSYWSLSPPLTERVTTTSGIPVGTTSDDEYFNFITKWILKNIMAVDNSVLRHTDPHLFYLNTCRQLLAAENLSFISVWNPSYLLMMFDFMCKYYDEIVSGVKCGRRRKELRQINEFKWDKIFPHLDVISCWTDAQASLWLHQFQSVTGNITIQSKGLMSTEGMVTIPTTGGNSIAFTSHFFEFINTENHQIYLAHELEIFQRYEVVITTGGGLYRYKTRDIVLVIKIDPNPILKFEGRSGVVCDMVGEKTDQLAVQEIFNDVLKNDTTIDAILLQPVWTEGTAYYQLYLFCNEYIAEKHLPEYVHDRLKENPYYRQAIELGQLGPIRTKNYPTHKLQIIAKAFVQQYGIKDGDAKLPVLLPLHLKFEL